MKTRMKPAFSYFVPLSEPELARRTAISAQMQARRDARTACKHGHPYTEQSTRLTATGRVCRTCNQIRQKAWQSRPENRAKANRKQNEKRRQRRLEQGA